MRQFQWFRNTIATASQVPVFADFRYRNSKGFSEHPASFAEPCPAPRSIRPARSAATAQCRYLVTLGDKALWITDGQIDIVTATDTLASGAAVLVAWGGIMSAFNVVESFRKNTVSFRRQVTISRDGEDFIMAFHPQNIVAFRHGEAKELRSDVSFATLGNRERHDA